VIKLGDPSNYPCPTGSCLTENCCEEVRCSNHNKAGVRGTPFVDSECDVGWMIKSNMSTLCPTGNCTTNECCVEIRCSNHNAAGTRDVAFSNDECSVGWVLKQNTTTLCSSGSCKTEDCCEPITCKNNNGRNNKTYDEGGFDFATHCPSGTH